ncbi:copper chaperone CopZ [Bacillus spongiae]|uniref:Copper chaperone CopZ n=1 Tax=Bacillus spongiae TaxID=2683610 RepID=A0ABU8HCR5_9BACI
MANTILNVEGMSCGHCVNAIEGSVGKLKGVNSVQVDLKAGKVHVDFNEAEVNLNQISETIDDQGYDVKKASV